MVRSIIGFRSFECALRYGLLLYAAVGGWSHNWLSKRTSILAFEQGCRVACTIIPARGGLDCDAGPDAFGDLSDRQADAPDGSANRGGGRTI